MQKKIVLGMPSLIACVLYSSFALTSVSEAAPWAPWPMFGGDAQHTKRSPFTAPRATPVLRWKVLSPGTASSPVVSANNSVIWSAMNAQVASLLSVAVGTGVSLWNATFAGFPGTPAVTPSGLVLVGCNRLSLLAFQVETGLRQWSFRTGTLAAGGPPVVSDDGIAYWGTENTAFALDTNTITARWNVSTSGSVTSSAALAADGATVYFPSIVAMSASSGIIEWYAPLVDNLASPAIDAARGVAYVGGINIESWNTTSGARVWYVRPTNGFNDSPAIDAAGDIYIASGAGVVYGVRPDGSVKWSFAAKGGIEGSPALDASGALFIGSLDASLYALDTATGKLLWSYQTDGPIYASPAIAGDGSVIVPSRDGFVYCFAAA